ncbi:unnamed protein product [Heligmosomoides polygyrus]|uniref:Reverse transcriptase domain-containing protein n=1 Tax=Heligmosomoides polygyrus TaxID=6339 RepID=A0A183FE04_HELPZ|nr:unnamed protein product [Heligmosomoides polygyrus]
MERCPANPVGEACDVSELAKPIRGHFYPMGCGVVEEEDLLDALQLNKFEWQQKGDASECSNYRGIKIISHTMKVYERLVDSRLRGMVTISKEQWGFMPERSTTDAIFIVRQVMEKYRKKPRLYYLAFLDLEKTDDRLPEPCSGTPFEGGVSRNV